MLGRRQRSFSPTMLECLCAKQGTRCGIKPVRSETTGWQSQQESLSIRARCDRVGTSSSTSAVVEVEGILMTRLTDRPAISPVWHATHNEALVEMHLDEIEALQELLETVEGSEHLGVVGRVPTWVRNRELPVELVEARPAADHELPRLDP